MKIVLNGDSRDIAQAIDLKTIVEQFCRDSNHVIAELNGAIIKRPEWPNRTLQEGDTLELVNFVGGG